MRHLVPAAALAALLAGCGLPPSQPFDIGAAAIDRSSGELWVGGRPYVLPPDVSDRGVRSGDRVRVYYEPRGDRRVVTRLEIEERLLFPIP